MLLHNKGVTTSTTTESRPSTQLSVHIEATQIRAQLDIKTTRAHERNALGEALDAQDRRRKGRAHERESPAMDKEHQRKPP